ncbi:hypothetical protein [Poseidonibacter lekithochrous]|nr:hypothetical protein [Poseidonibacter lekithochrous]
MEILYILLVSVVVIGFISLSVVIILDKYLKAKEIKNKKDDINYRENKRF